MGYCCSELCKAKPDQLQGSALLTGRAFVGLQICSSANTVIARPSSASGQSLHWPANRSFANSMTAERAAEAKMLQS